MSRLDYVDPTEDDLRMIVFKAWNSYSDRQLLDFLRSEDPILRNLSARLLHLRPSESNFKKVADLCQANRFEWREVGAFVLGQLGTPKCQHAPHSFAILDRLLDDHYYEVQSAATAAIGQLAARGHQPSDELVQRILKLADNGCPEIRESVAYALLGINERIVVPVINRLRKDNSANVRDAADFVHNARRELRKT